MSKKKATMTLKDFHGGSIPSDLPLPSAPGVIVRPSDRASFDRQTSWGNPMGRSDHRLRPGSAGPVRNFDDKTPFLARSVQIGRNFDEDERKPLEGDSGPRRMVAHDSIRSLPIRAEPERVPSRPVSTPSSVATSSYAGRFTETAHVGVNSQNFSGGRSYSASEGRHLGLNHQNTGANSGKAGAGSYPNAWGLRKEAVGVAEPVLTPWSAPDAVTKLAHASALEKVSSGRWHSKQPIHHQIDVEDIRHPETESELYSKGNIMYSKNTHNAMDVPDGREFHDATLVKHAERSLAVDDVIRVGSKELPAYERARSPMYSEMKEMSPRSYVVEVQPSHNIGKFVGSELQSPVPSESSERPKLKLLPRSKPVENFEPPVDYKLSYQQPSDPGLVENGSETHGNANPTKPGSAGSESGYLAVERPKLCLKPRSQPLEQLEVNIERESHHGHRNTLFGGARPRELVLKERGVDDAAVNNHDLGQPPNRVKQDVLRTETLPVHATPTRYNEKAENIPLDHRIGKNIDRGNHRVDVEKTDAQRKNWRSENRRNSRELEQQQQPQKPQERPHSPETWRKPVVQPASLDAPGPRYGKAASAVELAQAFSRSVSDPKTADRLSGQRDVSRRGQIPFSRLTGPPQRAQINSY